MIPLTENPPPRHPDRPVREAEGPWWIAKVKPRQEKALAWELYNQEIEYYLPMYLKITRRRDNNKPRKSVVCLFEGYICYCASRGHERDVFRTGRVVNLVEVRNQKRFIDELDQIYHALERGVAIEPLTSTENLLPGTRIRVESGPMRGIVGSVIRVQGAHKLILSVEGLGRAAVAIEASCVKPL
ncbi:MAG: hypothetical protein GF344_06740 [Chitinivibrionales bacterium]|nr:hypothetical protein [Chitinivibrionales bacterium]MBD3356621.1 hypothetical protein [Chitinivibrionales bacterium]